MTLQNKGTYKNKLTLYILPEKKEVVQKARLLFKREGSSLSAWFISELEAYVNLHWPGNPQLTFTQQSELCFPPSAEKLKPKEIPRKVSRETHEMVERWKKQRENGGT